MGRIPESECLATNYRLEPNTATSPDSSQIGDALWALMSSPLLLVSHSANSANSANSARQCKTVQNSANSANSAISNVQGALNLAPPGDPIPSHPSEMALIRDRNQSSGVQSNAMQPSKVV